MSEIKLLYTPNGNVKMSTEKPPVWDSVCSAFNIIPSGAVFTYGDTIFNPNNFELIDHIIEHEKVHMDQQGHSVEGAEIWWGKFLRDPQFRIDQEAQAYARQYDFLCGRIKGKQQRFETRMKLAKILAGELYARAITTIEAEKLIRSYSKVGL